MLESVALYLSLVMAIYLFAFSFWEGIKIANSDEKVFGGTFIISITSAFIFSGLTYAFN
ncbi:hypothetical protein SM124_09580 [Bacillus sp. 31A1R]|uniref:Uncharacterized protein n=1 Tax=Robertmurraya mangrovi TaxID=3098077 RepID=A0ABU5IXZ4_9BACI|nr:hypothetical protein [Bacillus sp. 31A1R]MDZ5471996.1 hypothetical protein [Bacillus sp. 31A1R]